MIVIDGAAGEGGGQILRNALALSLVTAQPFRINNIRGGREKPGLMRQHVTAIQAAMAVGNGTCDGLTVGAATITFHPGRVRGGAYHFAVGTAGSTALVLQAVLPPLMLADSPSRLVIEGGTHAAQAPPFEFLAATLLPLLCRMGPQATIRLIRPGFFPVGGGRIEVTITPAAFQAIDFTRRGAMTGLRARALVAGLPRTIAERELASAAAELKNWPADAFTIDVIPGECGPGNALLLQAAFEQVTETVSGFGQIRVSAERIGRSVGAQMNGYLTSGAFAGPHLADQLLVPMALAGAGTLTTVRPTDHCRSAALVIQHFLDREIRFGERERDLHLLTVA